MNARREQWMQEKPQFTPGAEISPATGDVYLFHFAANGDEGERFIKVYRAHVIPAMSKNGKRYTAHKYCPVKNGDDGARCQYCDAGLTDIKERMSMWLFIEHIFHANLPQNMQLERKEYLGRTYFHEPVGQFKQWNTSAWRESPWSDINRLSQIYKGLHNFTAQMDVTGAGLEKRYKVIALPETPAFDAALYQKAMAELEPIPDILRKDLVATVNIVPAEQLPPGAVPVTGNVQPVAAFSLTPSGAPAVSSFQLGASPAPVAPAPVVETVPTPVVEPKAAPVEVPASQPEEDERRPLQKLF